MLATLSVFIRITLRLWIKMIVGTCLCKFQRHMLCDWLSTMDSQAAPSNCFDLSAITVTPTTSAYLSARFHGDDYLVNPSGWLMHRMGHVPQLEAKLKRGSHPRGEVMLYAELFFRFISLSSHTHVPKQAHVHADACFTIQLNTCTQYMLCKHGPKPSTSQRAPSRFSRIITCATLKNLNVFFLF